MSSEYPRSPVPFTWPHAQYVVYQGFLPYLEVLHWTDPSHVRDGWSQQPQPCCSNIPLP